MLDWVRRIFSPQNYMEWKLGELLSKHKSFWYAEYIQEILDLNISILAKFLFLYESYDWATKTIWKLSREQKNTLLEEIEKINLENNSWRIWMYKHIVELCKWF